MFKTRLLKWQLICLLIIGFLLNSRAFAVEDQNGFKADSNNVAVSDNDIALKPATDPVTNINTDEPVNPIVAKEETSTEDVSSEYTPTEPPDGETIYSKDIFINEVLPAPKNLYEKEFVELYNGSEEAIDLVDWCLDDIPDGGHSLIKINTTSFPRTPDVPNFIIESHAYIVFEFENVFNNTGGDSVRLLNPNNEVVSQVDYTTTKEDQSYSLISGGWVWTTPSPGEVNIAPPKTEETVANQSISQIKKLEDGVEVITEGIATVLPGILSSQYFYMQDQESGIQIYSYYKVFAQFQEGDLIRIHGELSSVSGERRIKTTSLEDFTIISKGNAILPTEILGQDINDSIVGKYIQVQGLVKSTSGKEFILEGAPELKVIIRDTTGIVKPRMEKGDKVIIQGILSKYNSSFRLLPLKQNDVTIVTSNELPLVGPNIVTYLNINLIIYQIFIAWNIFLKAKKRLIASQKKLHQNAILAMFMHFLAT